ETGERVREDHDKKSAAAGKDKSDPLAALKNLSEQVDRLIADQKDAKDNAAAAQTANRPDQLPQQAPKQSQLAQRTDALKNQPLPNKPEVQNALDKANQAMNKAADALKDKMGNEAVARQDEALKQLDEAKKAIDEKVAEIEKRRDDLAKLEEAAKKLQDLSKEEKGVSDKANDLAKKADADAAKDLARKQDDLTPQAKQLDKD